MGSKKTKKGARTGGPLARGKPTGRTIKEKKGNTKKREQIIHGGKTIMVLSNHTAIEKSER